MTSKCGRFGVSPGPNSMNDSGSEEDDNDDGDSESPEEEEQDGDEEAIRRGGRSSSSKTMAGRTAVPSAFTTTEARDGGPKSG